MVYIPRLRNIFKSDSFIARPPSVINVETRICLEAIAFSVRAIAHNLNVLHGSTDAINVDHGVNVSDEQILELFCCCCQIVDQLYNFKNLLLVLGKISPETAALIHKYESAYRIRNKFDHLSVAIKNLAAKKKASPTTFGALAFYKDCKIDIERKIHHGHIVVLPFGNLSHQEHSFPGPNPLGKRIILNTTSHFEFSAFGEVLEMEPLFTDLPKWVDGFEKTLRDTVMIEAERIADLSGAKMEELLTQPIRPSIVFELNMEI